MGTPDSGLIEIFLKHDLTQFYQDLSKPTKAQECINQMLQIDGRYLWPVGFITYRKIREFRPLIQIKCDRDTGKVFEVVDGLMLKDGYVYKKVSLNSLSLWGVMPTEEELSKFGPSENNESNDLEWLSQLYGDKKEKWVIRPDKGGGGKGESIRFWCGKWF